MKQLKKYCTGMLLLATIVFVTACGRANNGTTTDFDTDEDGVYDHTDVDGDGLLEEIGRDANDVVDDLVNDMTGDDTMVDGDVNDNGTSDGALEGGTGTDLP